MLTFTVIGLSIIIGIILVIIGNKHRNSNTSTVGDTMIVFGAVALIVSIMDIQYPKHTELTKAEYLEIQREVQQISRLGGQECDLTVLAKKDLFENVREMNKTIDKHRIYNKSLWLNWFYSEEIGNLPKLDYVSEK